MEPTLGDVLHVGQAECAANPRPAWSSFRYLNPILRWVWRSFVPRRTLRESTALWSPISRWKKRIGLPERDEGQKLAPFSGGPYQHATSGCRRLPMLHADSSMRFRVPESPAHGSNAGDARRSGAAFTEFHEATDRCWLWGFNRGAVCRVGSLPTPPSWGARSCADRTNHGKEAEAVGRIPEHN